MPCLTNHFSILEQCTVETTEDMKSNSTELPDEVKDNEDVTPAKLIRNAHATTRNSTLIKLLVHTIHTTQPFSANALLDSGATACFIDLGFVNSRALQTRPLPRAIPVYNIDGTLNEAGSITQVIDLVCRFQDHSERMTFHVTQLGSQPIILGHNWLVEHNPEIDWKSGELKMSRCPEYCQQIALRIRANRKTRERSKQARKARQDLPSSLPERSPSLSGTTLIVEEGDQTENFPDQSQPSPGPIYCIPTPKCTPRPLKYHPDAVEEGDRIFCIRTLPIDTPESQEVNATGSISQQLAEKAWRKGYHSERFEDLVPKPYQEFVDVFSKESFDQLPERKPWDHAVELTPDAKFFSTKVYPMSPVEQKELDTFLDENLKTHRIRPSKSPMASPVFFVKKKDGGLRFVQDYRKLNAMTVKNTYPLPLIPDIMNRISTAKARYFTKLDVRWGYNNVRMREGDEWKAAFRTNRGLYEPLVMFFGLTNSPATFQTMMNDIFKELIDEGFVSVYMDDILIFTETLEQHQQIVRRVLEILRQNKLYLKPEKCQFERTQVEYLGLILSEGRVEMDPIKVGGVKEWPTPRSVTEVRSFLGFCNFYRRFIQDFSHVARPLNDLTTKDRKWTWGGTEKAAFDELKRLITSTPILVQPDHAKPFRLETDASGFATGAVLSQPGADDKWHPIGFISKSFDKAERNYEIHDKELLSVIRGLEDFRHILEGATHPVEVLNDHRNLTYFQTAQNLNRRQARWALFLSRFNISLVHRAGKHSAKPDALSRRADHNTGEDDNKDEVLLRPELFAEKIRTLTSRTPFIGPEQAFIDRIRSCEDRDEAVVKALKELGITRNIRGDEWADEDGMILYRGKIYVPLDANLRHDIVKAHHDSAIVGHPGRWKTHELVARNYWWPGLGRYVAKYVKGCDKCNRTKTFPTTPVGKLMPNRIPDRRWQVISVDLIVELPESRGYNAIMVVVDRLSKRAHLIPTTNEVDSIGIARLFRDHVWKLHGIPEEVISDRGPQFVSQFMRELSKFLDIKIAASTAFHPQTDGQTERVNQEIEQYLRVFVNQRQDDWYDWLALAEFSYNDRIHASTQTSPFMLDTGQHPRLGFEPIRESRLEGFEEFSSRMKKATEEAKAALTKAADDMARFYDVHHGESPPLEVGDKVWLDASHVSTNRPKKKLDDKWLGPYPIVKVISRNAYKLKLPTAFGRTHPVFNVSLLRPFSADEIPERPTPRPPPPIIRDGHKEFEVEKILDSRLRYNRLEYLIRWKGYGRSDDTWEPARDVKAARLVREFHSANPQAPRLISAAIFAQLPFQRYENFTEPKVDKKLFDWESGTYVRRDATP
jgi:hypothetical protein